MIAAAAPFLMFQGRCEEALTFYAAAVPGARIVTLDRKPDGQVAMARMAIAGLEIMANDSPPVHDFDFTPSTSTFLSVESADEVDALAAALAADGGSALMPAGDYGFSRRFAWVKDRFGPSWQINCP
ncbi:MAG TPA: VOC family protein [Brevundimonas sp.]|uniref:VOC family protein n=1 Tax=Brevundimonas sp. TaxID=1871086 RepID=UPI002DEB55BF|nr:VOC family protein [Brevundimonas sp.]